MKLLTGFYWCFQYSSFKLLLGWGGVDGIDALNDFDGYVSGTES